ncbi:MAG: malate:quinone oxidoreductase, partial [Verrucomicrobiota bacterium]
IRVQAIKKTDGRAGIVHYGTEVITDASGTLSALLGASPGASVSVNIILEVIKKCFPHLLDKAEARKRMNIMIPTWNEDLRIPAQAARFRTVSEASEEILGLRARS